jgi:hypothetical protein
MQNGSDGFRVSLPVPCRAVDSAGNLRARYWSERTFRCGRVRKKFFTLSFPERQGKGGAALPCRLSPFGAVAAASAIVASFFSGVARDRQEQRDLAPGEHADEV